jgi:hemin uptake protein HemP
MNHGQIKMTLTLKNAAQIAIKPRLIESSELFDQHKTVTIVHQGEHYILRLTANNKLILTK